MTDQPLSCQEFVELVTDYFEGALPAEDVRRFEEHLAQCPGCHTYLEQMRRTIDVLGRLPEESIPRTAQEQLLSAFRAWKMGRGPTK